MLSGFLKSESQGPESEKNSEWGQTVPMMYMQSITGVKLISIYYAKSVFGCVLETCQGLV
jgi:hypothetical protein